MHTPVKERRRSKKKRILPPTDGRKTTLPFSFSLSFSFSPIKDDHKATAQSACIFLNCWKAAAFLSH
jgi:hypothetical protein